MTRTYPKTCFVTRSSEKVAAKAGGEKRSEAGSLPVENVFCRQRGPRPLQPPAVDRGFGIGSTTSHGYRYSCPLLFVLLFAAAGCPPKPEPLPICPGRGSVLEAVAALEARAQKAAPLRANGQCRLELNTEKKKKHRENFPVKVWINPPFELYLQGDVAFDARGVVVGTNEEEFWLWIRPKEISGYWYGRWSEAGQLKEILINPQMVLESLGIAAVGGDLANRDWSLSNEGPFDILAQRSEQGLLVKKFYLSSCDYLVRKIEYFDSLGQATAVAELGRYKQLGEGFSIPTYIEIIKHGKAGDDSVCITFNPDSVKPKDFDQKLRDLIFIRPPPKGFAHIWTYIRGHWVEQIY
jgi:hypothetical protein